MRYSLILSRASYTHTWALCAKPRNYVSIIYKQLPGFLSTNSTVKVESSRSRRIIVVKSQKRPGQDFLFGLGGMDHTKTSLHAIEAKGVSFGILLHKAFPIQYRTN